MHRAYGLPRPLKFDIGPERTTSRPSASSSIVYHHLIKCLPTHFMWWLILKLLIRLFSWHPQHLNRDNAERSHPTWPFFTQVDHLVNHRAKRGGSLFQGRSGGREGSRSAPPGGRAKPPPQVAKRPFVCGGVPLRSWVFNRQFVLNVDGFGWNLAGMIFGSSLTVW